MADLEACYFCGGVPEGSLGEYAVVPAALSPSPDQQTSVVLCPTCREKLTNVMKPVVEAAGRSAERTGGEASLEDATTAAEPGEPSVPAPDGESGSGGSADATATAEASGEGPERADDAGSAPDSDGEPGAAVPRDADDEGISIPPADDDGGPSDRGSSDGEAPDDDGPPRGEEPAVGEADDAAEPSPGADESDESDDSEASGGPGDERTTAEEGTGEDGGEGAGGAPDEDPRESEAMVGRESEAYRKTLRLLQNREFPVERAEIEQVAASAYELDPGEVSGAIDALLQKGLLSQEGAHLHRT